MPLSSPHRRIVLLFLQPHPSSVPLFCPPPPLVSLSSLLSSHSLHPPLHTFPLHSLHRLSFLTPASRSTKWCFLCRQQQFLEGSQANKPSQCPLHDSQRDRDPERQRERQRRRRRRIIKMRGQKGFRMLRADEGRGRLGKEKKKKWRENERL